MHYISAQYISNIETKGASQSSKFNAKSTTPVNWQAPVLFCTYMKMIAAFLSTGLGVLKYTPINVALLVFGTIVFSAVAVFLVITAYYHYVHWMYSHIPQPKRQRHIHS